MTSANPTNLRFVFAGEFSRDYILLPDGTSVTDVPGGGALYAAAGAAVWEKGIGLIGRIGKDYPHEWLEQITGFGFDLSGIHKIQDNVDLRRFIAYPTLDTPQYNFAVSHYARLGIKFPKPLLGYQCPPRILDSRKESFQETIQVTEVPDNYFIGKAVHLCPLDYLSHLKMTSALFHKEYSMVTIDPSLGYMDPKFLNDVRSLVRDILGVITSEEKIRALYKNRTSDIWEMADDLAANQCEIVVIKRGSLGQYLYIAADHTRWLVPSYPAKVVDPTGAGDSFCGGFLAGYWNNFDPLEAVLYGNISASLTIGGSGPFFVLQVSPELATARLNNIRKMPRRI